MNTMRRLREIEAEMARLDAEPRTPENDNRYWELNEERRDLLWDFESARFYFD